MGAKLLTSRGVCAAPMGTADGDFMIKVPKQDFITEDETYVAEKDKLCTSEKIERRRDITSYKGQISVHILLPS